MSTAIQTTFIITILLIIITMIQDNIIFENEENEDKRWSLTFLTHELDDDDDDRDASCL